MCCAVLSSCFVLSVSGLLLLTPDSSLSERTLHRDVRTAYGEALLTREQRLDNLCAVLRSVHELEASQPQIQAQTPETETETEGETEGEKKEADRVTAEVILEGR